MPEPAEKRWSASGRCRRVRGAGFGSPRPVRDAAAEDRERYRGGPGRFGHVGARRFIRQRDHHRAGEVSERIVGEVPTGGGRGDVHLRGHPPEAFTDEIRGGSPRYRHAEVVQRGEQDIDTAIDPDGLPGHHVPPNKLTRSPHGPQEGTDIDRPKKDAPITAVPAIIIEQTITRAGEHSAPSTAAELAALTF